MDLSSLPDQPKHKFDLSSLPDQPSRKGFLKQLYEKIFSKKESKAERVKKLQDKLLNIIPEIAEPAPHVNPSLEGMGPISFDLPKEQPRQSSGGITGPTELRLPDKKYTKVPLVVEQLMKQEYSKADLFKLAQKMMDKKLPDNDRKMLRDIFEKETEKQNLKLMNDYGNFYLMGKIGEGLAPAVEGLKVHPVVKNAISGGIYGGGFKAMDEADKKAQDKDYSWSNVLKNIGLGAAFGALGGAAFGAAVNYFGKRFQFGTPADKVQALKEARGVLGVDESADMETIRAAFIKKIKPVFPRVQGMPEEEAQRIISAYNLLKDIKIGKMPVSAVSKEPLTGKEIIPSGVKGQVIPAVQPTGITEQLPEQEQLSKLSSKEGNELPKAGNIPIDNTPLSKTIFKTYQGDIVKIGDWVQYGFFGDRGILVGGTEKNALVKPIKVNSDGKLIGFKSPIEVHDSFRKPSEDAINHWTKQLNELPKAVMDTQPLSKNTQSVEQITETIKSPEGAIESGGITMPYSGNIKELNLSTAALKKIIEAIEPTMEGQKELLNRQERINKHLSKYIQNYGGEAQDVIKIAQDMGFTLQDISIWQEHTATFAGKYLGQLGNLAQNLDFKYQQELVKEIDGVRGGVDHGGKKELDSVINKIKRGEDVLDSDIEKINIKDLNKKEALKTSVKRYKDYRASKKRVDKTVQELSLFEKLMDLYKKIDNPRRGIMTMQMISQMRNAGQSIARVGVRVVENAIGGTIAKALNRGLDARKAYAELFADVFTIRQALTKSGRAELDRFMEELPLENVLLKKSYIGMDSAKVSKWINTLHAIDRISERNIKRAVFVACIRGEMAARGYTDWKDIPEGEQDQITAYAINEAYEMCFDSQMQHGFKRALKQVYARIPVLTTVNPFPKFWATSLQFLWDYNPTGFFNFIDPKYRAAFSSKDFNERRGAYRKLRKAVLGTMMLSAAYAIRKSKLAGDKWYMVRTGKDSQVDMRPFAPFVQYLFLSQAIIDTKEGKQSLSGKDFGDALLSISRLAGTGLALFEIINSKSSDPKVAQKIIGDFVGKYVQGFTVPLNTLDDFLGQAISEEKYYRDVNLWDGARSLPGRVLGHAIRNIPGVKQTLPKSPLVTRPGFLGNERSLPEELFRQATGVAIKPIEPVQKEMSKYGIEMIDILPKTTTVGSIDYEARKMMGEMIDKNWERFYNDTYLNSPNPGEALKIYLHTMGSVARQTALAKAKVMENKYIKKQAIEEYLQRQ